MDNPKTLAETLAEIKSQRSAPERTEVPALWNPAVAILLSLPLTPAFGAFVQMDNWNALGDSANAAKSKAWMIAGLVWVIFMPLVFALEERSDAKGLSGIASIAMLALWFCVHGNRQTAVVSARFGTAYPHNGWLQPILFALALGLVLMGISMALLSVLGLELP